MDSKTFRDFYFLKEELVKFCKDNGLPTSGGKIEITDRIAYYFDTGKILSVSRVKRAKALQYDICLNTVIESDFVCTEKHRAFLKNTICAPIRYCLYGVVLTWIIVCKLLTYLIFYIKI